MRRAFVDLAGLALILAVVGCALPQLAPSPGVGDLAAKVAGTLTAVAPVTHGSATAAPRETPTASPSPTLTQAAMLRIAYASGGNVYAIEASHPPRQLTFSGGAEQVRLSGDGALIAFTRREKVGAPPEIRSVHAGGGAESIVLTTAQLSSLNHTSGMLYNDVLRLAFIPGTHRLAFNTHAVFEGPGLARYDDLQVIDLDGGGLTTLLPAGAGGDFAFSPDGRRVALTHADSVALADVDGGNLRTNLVVFPPVITYSEYAYHPLAVWRPDSSAVGFAIPSEDPLAPTTSGTVWIIPADGGPAVKAGTISGQFLFTQMSTPALSPNLQRVAFLRETATTNIRQLYIANADGSGATPYATGDLAWDGWAPDSAHFVYTLRQPDADANRMQLGTIGGPPKPLSAGTGLRWIDDSTFVFLASHGGRSSLALGSVDGSVAELAQVVGTITGYDLSR